MKYIHIGKIYIYILYIHVHTYIHTHIHTYIYIHTHTCIIFQLSRCRTPPSKDTIGLREFKSTAKFLAQLSEDFSADPEEAFSRIDENQALGLFKFVASGFFGCKVGV